MHLDLLFSPVIQVFPVTIFLRKFEKLLEYHLNKIPNIFTESLVIVNSIPNIHYNKSQ